MSLHRGYYHSLWRTGVFVGYFDDGGLLDLAARNLSNGTIHLAFGNGTGGFDNWYNDRSQITGSAWNMFAH